MKQLKNNLNYLDIVEPNTDTVSLIKTSLRSVHRINGAVFLELLDDDPYFLDYKLIENPLTPGVAYVNVGLLYLDVLEYLRV
jgi:hypothetical protein